MNNTINYLNLVEVSRKSYFGKMEIDWIRRKFEKHVYKHIILENEEDFFDIEIFVRKYVKGDFKKFKPILNEIILKLERLGWKCKLSFGGTGLFIYSTEEPPVTCYEDGL